MINGQKMTPQAPEARTEARYCLPAGDVRAHIHFVLQGNRRGVDAEARLLDVSERGAQFALESPVTGVGGASSVHWAVESFYGVATLVRITGMAGRIALHDRRASFRPLLDWVRGQQKTGAVRLGEGPLGSEANLIGHLRFGLAKTLFPLLPRIQSINLSQVVDTDTAGVGALLHAVERGVSLKGCNSDVARLLELARVCAVCSSSECSSRCSNGR